MCDGIPWWKPFRLTFKQQDPLDGWRHLIPFQDGSDSDQMSPHDNPPRVLARSSKTSGFPGCTWNQRIYGWVFDYRSMMSKKRYKLYFPISQYRRRGRSEAQAEKAAVSAVKRKREELEQKGEVAPSRLQSGTHKSTLKGVTWHKRDKLWVVRIKFKSRAGNMVKDTAYTKPKSDKPRDVLQARSRAEAKYHELAEKHGLTTSVNEVRPLSQYVKRRSPVPGVQWMPYEKAWRASWREPRSRSRKEHFHVARLAENSLQEDARCFNEAVAWLRRQGRVLSFRVGHHVSAKYKDGEWYPAVIVGDSGDGFFTLAWDGDPQDDVVKPQSLIQQAQRQT